MDRNAIRQRFKAQGISITDWATARGFNRDHVYAVLRGRTYGDRGQAHQIAVALGLKESPEQSGEVTLLRPVAACGSNAKE